MLLYQGFIRPSYDYPGIQDILDWKTKDLYQEKIWIFFDFNQVISESNILKLISYRDWEVHHIQVQFIKVVRKRSG